MKPSDTWRTTVVERQSRAVLARVLTGRLAEYQELLDQLSEGPGLLVVAGDPWSGTSALLGAALAELDGPAVGVDARSCSDAMDLAMTIADDAVRELAAHAAAWWSGAGPPAGRAGLRIMRLLSDRGIELEQLRMGEGVGLERLSEAIELLLALGRGEATLAIDHIGLLLAALSPTDARDLLGVLRSLRQAHPTLDLVLVEHPDGVASAALADERHPLFRAGQRMRIRRPTATRFHQDLAITRAWTRVRADLLVSAAELAAGVPALTWQVIDLAPSGERRPRTAAAAGWEQLRSIASLSTAREWDLLRRVHPLAQWAVAAVASGLGPHAVAANSKSINDALRRLRELGIAWQPGPRRWLLADPLLAAWACDHAPPWAMRRRVAVR
jgi:hypothetical protein